MSNGLTSILVANMNKVVIDFYQANADLKRRDHDPDLKKRDITPKLKRTDVDADSMIEYHNSKQIARVKDCQSEACLFEMLL